MRTKDLLEGLLVLWALIGPYYEKNEEISRKKEMIDPWIKKVHYSEMDTTIYTLPKDVEKVKGEEYIIYIDKEKQKMNIYKKVEYVKIIEADVSTGLKKGKKKRQGDMKTPEGLFRIQSVENSSEWLFKGEKAYGPYFSRLNTGSWDKFGNHNPRGRSSIGIHGTNEPEYLGKRRSHGCIRISNELDLQCVEKGYFKKGRAVLIR